MLNLLRTVWQIAVLSNLAAAAANTRLKELEVSSGSGMGAAVDYLRKYGGLIGSVYGVSANRGWYRTPGVGLVS